MAVEWKKILLDGDAAEPSDNAPADVGTTASAGVGANCSRDDHVHDTAAGFIDSADKFTAGVVDTTALGADAVTGDKIGDDQVNTEHIAAGAVDTTALGADAVDGTKIADDAVGSEHIEQLDTALDFGGQQATDLVLHTVADAAARDALTPVLGKFVWQTDVLHPFICTSIA